MATLAPPRPHVEAATTPAVSRTRGFLTAALSGLAVSWPYLTAVFLYGPFILTHALIGDSYHYLAIARKATEAHIYTYDGTHVTNGFHPLWQYSIRAILTLLHLQSHAAQGIALMLLALASVTIGAMLASAAILRITGRTFLAMLVTPGLFYLTIGVHVRSQAIWSALIGMESAYSVLFGGLFFYVASYFIGLSARRPFNPITAARAIGLVLPLLILSRLDDIFLVPAFLLALYLFEHKNRTRLIAATWLAAPSALAVSAYMLYNKLTVGAPMPLSGATKSHFVAPLTAYLTAAVHLPFLTNLSAHLTHKPNDGATLFAASFRFIEVLYPLVIAAFAAAAIWRYRRRTPQYAIFFAVCAYIVLKMSFNFLMVHPWHQAAWYYGFATLSLSVLGAYALQAPYTRLTQIPIATYAVYTVYTGLTLLSASQFYATLVYQSPDDALTTQFWQRSDDLRTQLIAHHVTGLINNDDGITAFLLDLPMMHGFAFATDVEAQRAHRTGTMLTLATQRHINTLTGFGYMATNTPPQTEADIRTYLRQTIAYEPIRNDLDHFSYTLAYYDPTLKMPFITFTPKPSNH